MHVVGLITEYNPFHNGHLHHLQESLRVTGADASVAVMSGHFLQRGEPALVDKWVRTEMALAAGVDLVFELPFPFACNSAPHFAAGAIRSLAALGVVDSLCFGSELGELTPLSELAGTLRDNAAEVARRTAARLRRGINYPAARADVLGKLKPELPVQQMASPNNVLGIEYLQALAEIDAGIVPWTIRRRGAGYAETGVVDKVASATGIRKMLAQGDRIDDLVPPSCRAILDRALSAGQNLSADRLFIALQAHLLQNPSSLTRIHMVSDGLDRRLHKAALEARCFDTLVAGIKSRPWTQTRVQRILMYVLLQALSDEIPAFQQAGPLYLRLLGHSETGQRVLARVRKRKSLPLIADPAKATNTLRKFYRHDPQRQRLAEMMLEYDLRATQLYGLLQHVPTGDCRNQDYYQPVRRA